MKSPSAGDLEDYLLNKVDLRRQQISQIVEEVQRVIHHLTTEISLQDLRFQAVPYSDTYNGNIKVLAPSQFLVTVPVKGLVGYREAREQRWRYYTLRGTRLPCPLQDPEGLRQWLEAEQFMKSQWQWHEADVNIEGDIVPAKVLQVFRKLVENAIGTCHLSGKVSMLTQLSAVWVAVETSTCQVELELVPTVEIPTVWPEKARWPPCLKRWPSRQRVECIKSFGFALLACSNYHWQQSFLQAEQVLLDQLDEDGGCRRKCFQALRQMKEDVWCPGRRPVVTSHHLQAESLRITFESHCPSTSTFIWLLRSNVLVMKGPPFLVPQLLPGSRPCHLSPGLLLPPPTRPQPPSCHSHSNPYWVCHTNPRPWPTSPHCGHLNSLQWPVEQTADVRGLA
ncbi:protein mab-21-like 3 isoform X1 [Lynx canadensis]|uniref:Mab-21 like 3 n=1 Tax=Lynx canadensis TaxID=61383 RepID=A0A667HY31_LYNCA|nr:protein mab-21-like 3 isoform X1 [Lynx canadensis]XP_030179777.1 protein mab-21-like 3 isoform X1 [Lynx canadensis]XP_030179778.1 protein mab-21-like 3 isoform X1 [Lynx canadensis]